MILRSALWLSPAITLIAFLLQSSWVSGDADFESVRIKYDYRYMGGKGGDPKEKYWRKSSLLVAQLTTLTYLASTDESV